MHGMHGIRKVYARRASVVAGVVALSAGLLLTNGAAQASPPTPPSARATC